MGSFLRMDIVQVYIFFIFSIFCYHSNFHLFIWKSTHSKKYILFPFKENIQVGKYKTPFPASISQLYYKSIKLRSYQKNVLSFTIGKMKKHLFTCTSLFYAVCNASYSIDTQATVLLCLIDIQQYRPRYHLSACSFMNDSLPT